VKNRGHRVKILCLHDRGVYFEPTAQQVPTEVIGLPYKVRARALWKLRWAIAAERPNLVQSFQTNPNRWVPLAAKLAGVPVVVTGLQNCYFSETPMQRRVDSLLFRLATHAVSCSEAVWSFYVERKEYPGNKITTIHNGVKLDRFSPHCDKSYLRKELGLSEEHVLVGTVANLIPQKGHEYLLEAADLVVRENKQVVFVWIGDGLLRSELQMECAERGLTENIYFLSERKDIPEVLSSLDVFVLPSLWEGFGIALVEAMATGLPVIASNVDGIVEVVVDGITGVLVEPKDVEGLAKAIRCLLDDPTKRGRMGQAGRQRVMRRFSVENVASAYETLYRRLISDHEKV